MKKFGWIKGLLVLAAITAAFGLTWRLRGCGAAAEDEAATAGPVVRVKVAPLRRGRVEGSLTAFGTVLAAPDRVRIIVAPFPCRIRNLLVTTGQAVKAGTPVIEIEPSPDAQLELSQARQEAQAAGDEVKLVEQRLGMQLATRQDQSQAQQRLRAAQIHLQSLVSRGQPSPRTLVTEAGGVISRLDAQKGQIVPADQVLVEMIGSEQIEVRLGGEVEDQAYLHSGQTVDLLRVNGPEQTFTGKVRLVTRQVNPETRLVDVFVQPAGEFPLLLNEYVQGKIVISSDESLVAPREAVLPGEGSSFLFTVAGGVARKRQVTPGLAGEAGVQVTGEGLAEGQLVVVQGNSELEDGMSVVVER